MRSLALLLAIAVLAAPVPAAAESKYVDPFAGAADRELRFVNPGAPVVSSDGGRYVTPVTAHGVVFVATDRLHAFGADRP